MRAWRAPLQAGYAVLQGGGSSIAAITSAVMALEDNPLFNAGRGAVFTLEGRNELDASIMAGSTLNAGAVSGVLHIRIRWRWRAPSWSNRNM